MAAYLARNYGGAALFRSIVRNEYTDLRAITVPLNDLTGSANTLESMLRSWGAAVLFSDQNNLDPDIFNRLIFNKGASWFSSQPDGGILYYLGSINMENYRHTATGINNYGMRLYTPSTVTSAGKLHPSANRFIRVGENLTGQHTWLVTLDKNVRLTVVVK